MTMMKGKFFLLAVSRLLAVTAFSQNKPCKYVDASGLNIIGKVFPTSKPFTRIDTSRYKIDDKVIMRYAEHSTGLAVMFRTDSRNISARWVTSASGLRANMTTVSQKGLDLYIRQDGEWVFAGVGTPSVKEGHVDVHEGQIVADMAEGMKECLLYLPMFDRVDSLEIGIDQDACIESMENPFKFKIIFKGSSITHGISASRSGMTYPARFGRDNGYYVCNLGFSGKSKLQKEFAMILADAQADAFVFDAFSNPSAAEIRERFDAFVDVIRAAHPQTPLIFLQTERRETRNFNQKNEEREAGKQTAAEEVVRRRMQTDKNMYFIDSEGCLGYDHVGTVDGAHPNDIGFSRMLDCIGPAIIEILEGYGLDVDQPQKRDSLAFLNADWEVTDLGRGAQAMYASVPMFSSVQSVCVVKYPVRKFRTDIVHRPAEAADKPSVIGSECGAAFALNGGYFHVKQRIPSVYFREGDRQLGYTHPTELYRVDGLMGFKDRKGRKVRIKAVSDTTLYAGQSKGWNEAMASGPMLIADGGILVPVLTGDKADGANVEAMAQEKKQGAKIRTHYSSAQFYDKRHPRAAFGSDDEGKAYLVVIDGRFPGQADGATIYETAYICHLLGMTDAINLDGGGSTTLWTEKTGVINHPYDNKKFDHEGERSVPNLILVY